MAGKGRNAARTAVRECFGNIILFITVLKEFRFAGMKLRRTAELSKSRNGENNPQIACRIVISMQDNMFKDSNLFSIAVTLFELRIRILRLCRHEKGHSR
jgi:hypothetical protein